MCKISRLIRIILIRNDDIKKYKDKKVELNEIFIK